VRVGVRPHISAPADAASAAGAAPETGRARATGSARSRARSVAAARRAAIPLALVLLAILVAAAGLTTAADLLLGGRTHLGLLAANSGRVLLVDPLGPAARAGLAPGDLLVTGGGAATVGATVATVAARGGTLTTGAAGSFALFRPVAAAPSAVALPGDAVALAAALALWLSGIIAGLPRRRVPAGRLYALAAFALAVAILALTERDGADAWPWLALAPAALVGLAALLLAHLAAALGRMPPRRVTAAVAVVAGLPAIVALLGASVALPSLTDAWVAATLAVLAVAVIVVPPAFYARTTAEPTRRRLRVALLAGAVGLLPFYLWPGLLTAATLSGHSQDLLPLLRDLLHLPASAALSPLWSLLGVLPMAALYATLFNGRDGRRLDRYARVGLAHTLAAAADALVVAAALTTWNGAVIGVAVIAAIVAFPPLERTVERLLEQAVSRRQPDYRAALRRVENLAVGAATTAELAAGAVDALEATLQIRAVTLLVRGLDCPADRYRVVARRGASSSAHADWSLGSAEPTLGPALPAAGEGSASDHPRTAGEGVGRGGAVVRLNGLQCPDAADAAPAPLALPLTWPFGDEALRALDAVRWAPLWWNNRQGAVLLLGPRRSGEPYDVLDLEEIGALCGVLALAFGSLDLIANLRERTATLGHLTHRLAHAHEQERAHLSHELHDVVAQELIALTRQLRRYSDGRVAPAAIQADMLAAAQDALAATRRICNGLRPAILDLGLVPALRDLVADTAERATATEVSLSVSGREQRMAEDLEFALFRVAQEGLTNALTHARARQARLEVVFEGPGPRMGPGSRTGQSEEVATVCLRVRDDGRGFVPPARFEDLPGDHLGLIGMRERLAEFGGQLTLTSTPGQGTVLEACAPLSPAASPKG